MERLIVKPLLLVEFIRKQFGLCCFSLVLDIKCYYLAFVFMKRSSPAPVDSHEAPLAAIQAHKRKD